MKPKKVHTATVLTLAAALLTWQATACMAGDPDPAPEVLDRLEEKMTEVQTVSAEFVQEKELPVLERTMIIRGRMALEGPENIAWHVDEPVQYRLVIHGSRLQQWDEDTDRVQELDLDDNPSYRAMFQQLTSWFSGRYGNLLDQYTLEIKSDEPVVLRFTPREDATFEDIITSVTIVFGEDERYIGELQILEANGSLSTIRFHGTRLNEDIDDEVWKARPER